MDNQATEEMDFYQPKQKFFHQKIQKIAISNQNAQQLLKNAALVMSGFPYDEGTKRNGGRIGGAIASSIFRKRLSESNFYYKSNISLFDSEDIETDLELQNAHIELYQKHKRILCSNPSLVLFSIGGSNDQSYPNVRALLEAHPKSKIGVINLDAHFDVRPLKQGKAHSGSPFRQMLQNNIFQQNGSIFIEFACKGATCSNQHYQYLKQKRAEVYWLEKNIRLFQTDENSEYVTQAGQLFFKILSQLSQKVQYIFVSFDTDSINSKFMPGVSAPSVVGGLSSAEAVEITRIAGRQSKVRLLDFSQFNPAVESLISSKMLVQMFYSFCSGLLERKIK